MSEAYLVALVAVILGHITAVVASFAPYIGPWLASRCQPGQPEQPKQVHIHHHHHPVEEMPPSGLTGPRNPRLEELLRRQEQTVDTSRAWDGVERQYGMR